MKNLYLIGFMGAGKSTVAAELERQLHIPRAEMDALIVEREGMESPIFLRKKERHISVTRRPRC